MTARPEPDREAYAQWAARLFDAAKVPGRPPGYHTAHVYARHLGLGPSKLADLVARGII